MLNLSIYWVIMLFLWEKAAKRHHAKARSRKVY